MQGHVTKMLIQLVSPTEYCPCLFQPEVSRLVDHTVRCSCSGRPVTSHLNSSTDIYTMPAFGSIKFSHDNMHCYPQVWDHCKAAFTLVLHSEWLNISDPPEHPPTKDGWIQKGRSVIIELSLPPDSKQANTPAAPFHLSVDGLGWRIDPAVATAGEASGLVTVVWISRHGFSGQRISSTSRVGSER